MSEPIKQPGETDDGRKKRRWYTAFSGNAFLFTLLLHVILGVLATYLIVEHFSPKKQINFLAQGPPDPHTDIEHKVQMMKRNSVQSAPQDVKRIVSTDVSAITLPEVPDVPPPDDVTPTAMAGLGGDGLMGAGNGTGTGPGDGGGNPFGTDTAPPQPSFVGTFYDFKQNRDHRSTNMDLKKEQALLKDFIDNHWDEGTLRRDYFSSKNHIYANEILIPFQDSSGGPGSFGLEREVKPGYWAIVYHATLTPTHSGEFCVAGYGDDYLLVRIDGENVLDSGWQPSVTDVERGRSIPHGPWVNDRENKGSAAYGASVIGPKFRVNAGQEMKIDVLISDANPSNGIGRCGYFLMLLEADKDYADKDAAGNFILPILQIHADPNVKRQGEFPPFTCRAEDALVGPADNGSGTGTANAAGLPNLP